MPVTAEQAQEIKKMVWAGIYSRSHLIEIVTVERYAPEEIDAAAAEQLIDEEILAKKREEASWPAPTDCDRLKSLFGRLDQLGLAAVMHAGYTQSDALEDVDRLCAQRGGPGPKCFGYCFFHAQDRERAQDGQGLYLGFGDFSGDEVKGLAVANLIAAEARAQGFGVSWNKTFGSRILLTPFQWQNRGIPSDSEDAGYFPEQPMKSIWKRFFG